jgi:glycine/D-amino acid oxidase-like deaminating enzyme
MAREAGALQIGFNKTISQSEYSLFEHELKAFEALVRADEREACAKVCDAMANNQNEWAECRATAIDLADAIRARGNT